MTTTDAPRVTLTVPADVRYFRSVRLAIGGLATMVGFDIEAIDDLRIGVDELCAMAAEGGDGSTQRHTDDARPGDRHAHRRVDARRLVPPGRVRLLPGRPGQRHPRR